jgi:diguanylate cyclase (GGDEF)-like protein/PAS domain S-box-containing protein
MKQARILIVEDERIIALDLAQRLRNLGYEVAGTAASGEQALVKVRALGPDVVLMDIHLETAMDGTEAARQIRAESDTAVVFLTAYAEDDTLTRALVSLPFGYLVKPVDTRELHAVLQTTLARHASEQALAHSEQRLQLAMEAAGLGVWEWELGSGRFTVDGLFDQVLGEPPEALNETIERFLDRLHPLDRDRASETLALAVSTGGTVNGCFHLMGTHGAAYIEVHARAYRHGQVERLIGVIKDVSEQRRMEEELKQSAAVFQTISEGLFTLDANGRLTSANPAFSVLTGYELEEIFGRDPEDFLHARRHSDQFYQLLVAEKGGNWQGEIWCKRKNGEVFPVWECVRAVFEKGGGVSHYVAAISDITPLRRAEEKINHLAYHDPLTGLPNRMLFHDRLKLVLERAAREAKMCAVLFLDLDGFKSINDTLGHSSGDLLLQTVAARIKGEMRGSDTVARLGGDEFVVLVSDLARPDIANLMARKLLDVLSLPLELAGERIAVSASAGIAIYPNDGVDSQSLMSAADTAMYAAKSEGKNRACFYTQELAARAAERMNLEQGLRLAIAADGFVLHYQPQFRIADGALVGVEALIRWTHTTRGLIPPDLFIPIAEESGLIEVIGAWVMRTACAQVVAWLNAGGAPLRLSVNVSVRQMRHGDILEVLRRTLAETGFPPELMEIEITESTLQVLDDSRILLEQLHTLGVGVAIDDFGTGYSSLSVLKHLPIDQIKIDQSFVRDAPGDPHDVGIIEAIVTMGRVLGIGLIAEGVENEEQLAFLRGVGCQEVQGFLLGRPVHWEELVPRLEKVRG